MSCTDKNTMVFVVLEGEITVILHTTQFNAKKGDSFYIPPKVRTGSKLDSNFMPCWKGFVKFGKKLVSQFKFYLFLNYDNLLSELLQPYQPEGSGG